MSSPRREDGFTSTWVLLLAMVLLVLGIASVNIWEVFTEQRTLSAQADAAAAAGAQAVDVDAFSAPGGPSLALLPADAKALVEGRLEDDLGELPPLCAGAEPPTDACQDIRVQASPAAVTVTLRKRVVVPLFRVTRVVTATSTASPQVAN